MHVGSGAHTKMRDSLDLVINPHGTLQPAHAMSSPVKGSPLRVVRGSCCGIWAAVQVLKHLTQVANAQQLLHAHRHAHVSDTQARSHEGAPRLFRDDVCTKYGCITVKLALKAQPDGGVP